MFNYHLVRLMRLYPDQPWNFECLSYNPNITLDIIEKNPDRPWNWYYLSCNPNITWAIVQDHPDMPWDWNGLVLNRNITWEIIRDMQYLRWNWNSLGIQHNIGLDIVQNNPDRSWCWFHISINQATTWDIIQEHPDMPWDWYGISGNNNITWAIVQQNPQIKHWMDYMLICNEGLHWHDIVTYLGDELDKFRCMPYYNHSLTWEVIQDYPDYHWHECLSINPNVNCQIIEQNPSFVWNYNGLSINEFNANPYVFARLKKEYMRQLKPELHWEINRRTTRYNKGIFELVLHEFRLRLYDIDRGIRSGML